MFDVLLCSHRRIPSRLGPKVPCGSLPQVPHGRGVARVLDAVGEERDEHEQSQEDAADVGRRGVAHHPVVPVLKPVGVLGRRCSKFWVLLYF